MGYRDSYDQRRRSRNSRRSLIFIAIAIGLIFLIVYFRKGSGKQNKFGPMTNMKKTYNHKTMLPGINRQIDKKYENEDFKIGLNTLKGEKVVNTKHGSASIDLLKQDYQKNAAEQGSVRNGEFNAERIYKGPMKDTGRKSETLGAVGVEKLTGPKGYNEVMAKSKNVTRDIGWNRANTAEKKGRISFSIRENAARSKQDESNYKRMNDHSLQRFNEGAPNNREQNRVNRNKPVTDYQAETFAKNQEANGQLKVELPNLQFNDQRINNLATFQSNQQPSNRFSKQVEPQVLGVEAPYNPEQHRVDRNKPVADYRADTVAKNHEGLELIEPSNSVINRSPPAAINNNPDHKFYEFQQHVLPEALEIQKVPINQKQEPTNLQFNDQRINDLATFQSNQQGPPLINNLQQSNNPKWAANGPANQALPPQPVFRELQPPSNRIGDPPVPPLMNQQAAQLASVGQSSDFRQDPPPASQRDKAQALDHGPPVAVMPGDQAVAFQLPKVSGFLNEKARNNVNLGGIEPSKKRKPILGDPNNPGQELDHMSLQSHKVHADRRFPHRDGKVVF